MSKTKTMRIPFVGKVEAPRWALQLVEQTIHFILGAGITGIFWVIGLLAGVPVMMAGVGAMGATLVCLIRELIFQYPIKRVWDTVLDIAVWLTGALVVYLIAIFSPTT